MGRGESCGSWRQLTEGLAFILKEDSKSYSQEAGAGHFKFEIVLSYIDLQSHLDT